MARVSENPDRNFSANGDAKENFEGLRAALDFSEPALPFNEAAKARFGKVISDAILAITRSDSCAPFGQQAIGQI